MSGFVKGILSYFEALSLISKRGYSIYFLYSGLIGLIIVAACGFLVWSVSPMISGFVNQWIPWDIDLIDSISKWLSIGLSSILFISLFKYMMLIFTAPLMSVLSEKVENELTGFSHERSVVMNFIPDLLRALRINLRNIIREFGATIFLLLLGLIPVLAPIIGVLIIIVQSYYAGFGNYDFWAERHFSYRDTVSYMKRRKGALAGNGIVYVLILAIPVVGVFFAPPLATVASTIQGVKSDLSNSNTI